MSSDQDIKVALLEQRIALLEQHEDRQRNWKTRIYGWVIGPALGLLLGGLTMYAQINYNIIPRMDKIDKSLESIGNELGELHDKVEKYREDATKTYNAAVDVFNAKEE